MATWQFDFSIIPKKEALKKINQGNISIAPWDGYGISVSSIKELSKEFKQTKSWSDSIKQFGSLDETCIELCFEDKRFKKLKEVSIRLDLRSLTKEKLLKVIAFISDNNAMILTQEEKLIEPEINLITGEIKKSDAYSFVKDPYGFLNRIAGKVNISQ